MLNSQPGGFRNAPPGQRRPVQGNSPDDRKDYPDFQSSQESLRRSPIRHPRNPGWRPPGACALPGEPRALVLAFSRHDGIYRSDVASNHQNLGAGRRLPLVGPRAPVQGRDGRIASCSSSAMSSDRLFLDRVARQQSPSPLHRHPQNTMPPSAARAKGDISTLPGRGHFYFAQRGHYHFAATRGGGEVSRQSRNVPLTTPSWGDARRTATDDSSR
jgi:hypothetical protein